MCSHRHPGAILIALQRRGRGGAIAAVRNIFSQYVAVLPENLSEALTEEMQVYLTVTAYSTAPQSNTASSRIATSFFMLILPHFDAHKDI